MAAKHPLAERIAAVIGGKVEDVDFTLRGRVHYCREFLGGLTPEAWLEKYEGKPYPPDCDLASLKKDIDLVFLLGENSVVHEYDPGHEANPDHSWDNEPNGAKYWVIAHHNNTCTQGTGLTYTLALIDCAKKLRARTSMYAS